MDKNKIIVRGISRYGRTHYEGLFSPGKAVFLARDPTNEYDPNAVKVLLSDGSMLGYVAREMAGDLSKELEDGWGYIARIADAPYTDSKWGQCELEVVSKSPPTRMKEDVAFVHPEGDTKVGNTRSINPLKKLPNSVLSSLRDPLESSKVKNNVPLTLREIADDCRARLPVAYRNKPWALAYTNRNFTEIFTKDVQADAYNAAYIEMHIGKLRIVFEKANEIAAFDGGDISVIDWGCGQGLATLALNEYLREKGLSCQIRKIILIEPSALSLSRAKKFVHLCIPNAQIRAISKRLNDVVAEDVRLTEGYPIVNLFSNILDIQGISLKRIVENLEINLSVENVVLCASPFYPQMERRYTSFLSYFKSPLKFAWHESRPFSEAGSPYTYSLQFFKLEANKPEQILHYLYYPDYELYAGYALDCVFDAVADEQDVQEALTHLSAFSVYAPFEFDVVTHGQINPILAVINNIICRGLPTLCPNEVEEAFASETGCSKTIQTYGGRLYASTLNDETKLSIQDEISEYGKSGHSTANYLVYAPLAIARLQKILVEVILLGKLNLNQPTWEILVEEGDVSFARLAIDSFSAMYEHLIALANNQSELKLPSIHLTVVRGTNPSKRVRSKTYDMAVCYSSKPLGSDCNFSKYKVQNDCIFYVCSSVSQRDPIKYRQIMTADLIEYKELVRKNNEGLYSSIEENVGHLRYFLQLLFRKQDFRPGQLPILSRALRNKSVIGLLPTGGGKSLTYQLAAMLQPGVTLVIDPLISLMSDQYEGLKRSRIDCCAAINAKTPDALESETRMASSKLLFVFVSPERLCIMRFRQRMAEMNSFGVYFSYGVIDEVHCVSEWGHDFRFSYLHLGRNLYRYVKPRGCEEGRHISLFGLTATASFDVLSDVERDLSGEGAFPLDADAIVRYENTNRLELQYKVVEVIPGGALDMMDRWSVAEAKREQLPNEMKRSVNSLNALQSEETLALIRQRFLERESITDEETKRDILSRDLNVEVSQLWLRETPNKSAGIVFCPHRQGSLGVNDSSFSRGVATTIKTILRVPDEMVATYVGGDELHEQNRFLQGNAALMVSTKAFGMGIDKPNVRFTWHVNYSSSLESFVQEAGRAGRDRKMALSTILYCPLCEKQINRKGEVNEIPYDLDILKFFYDQSFKGEVFEKQVMYLLMNKGSLELLAGEHIDESVSKRGLTVSGFIDELQKSELGACLTYVISTQFNKDDPGVQWLQEKWIEYCTKEAKKAKVSFSNEEVKAEQDFIRKKYSEIIHKAIYRMCSIGIIYDYTENYGNNTIRVATIHRTEDEYYDSLKRFLMRYYTEPRAESEVAKAKLVKGENAIQKCLSYLTTFVYNKVAKKRKQAMWDIDSFCREAITSRKSWLETNEDLKDFIYYYFNSKYAREGYTTDSGEPFSLKDDTDGGKISSFEIVFKFMRVIDDDITGAEGSPRDNIKHLQGAVRLIRRSLTDVNPALDLLNVFCLMFLKKEIENSDFLKRELWSSYHQGYCDFRDSQMDILSFLANVKRFSEELKKRNVIDQDQELQLRQWQAEAEIIYQSKWLNKFSAHFTE